MSDRPVVVIDIGCLRSSGLPRGVEGLNAIIITAIVIGSIAAYLGVGYIVGTWNARLSWRYGDWFHEDTKRDNARDAFVFGLLAWPVAVFFCCLVVLAHLRVGAGEILDNVIPELAEKAKQRRAAEAEAENVKLRRQIDDLHRQLGIAPLRDENAS